MKRALQLQIKPWMVACQDRWREAKSGRPWVNCLIGHSHPVLRGRAAPGLNLRNGASHRVVVFPGVGLDLRDFFFFNSVDRIPNFFVSGFL